MDGPADEVVVVDGPEDEVVAWGGLADEVVVVDGRPAEVVAVAGPADEIGPEEPAGVLLLIPTCGLVAPCGRRVSAF